MSALFLICFSPAPGATSILKFLSEVFGMVQHVRSRIVRVVENFTRREVNLGIRIEFDSRCDIRVECMHSGVFKLSRTQGFEGHFLGQVFS